MSPRARVYFGVLLAAVTAVAVVVVGAALSGGSGTTRTTSARNQGVPRLALELGVRNDTEALALRNAALRYSRGERRQALAIFDRSRSLEAQVGAALASSPSGTLQRLEALARKHPRSSLVLVNLGIVRAWDGNVAAARDAWRRAKSATPDSAYAVDADSLLHPHIAPNVPVFIPSFLPPPSTTISSPAALRRLAAEAARGGVRQKLIYGVVLQQLGHQLSAERVFEAAAARAPGDPDARVAAAVARFDKDHPERAFSRLGPLVRVFPQAPTVRFHLGLLLAWLGQVDAAKRQLRLAYALGPSSPLGTEAKRFLQRLVSIRTK